MEFEGIFTPVITPHHADGAIHLEAFGAMIDHLCAAGVHCIVVGGSTGEYYAQSIDERIELIGHAQRMIDGRTQMMVGVGATRTSDAIRVGVAARELGADSLLVNSPPYAVPTDMENARHALAIDAAVGLPIMLYNYPHRTGTDMGPAYLAEVGRSPNVQAIKESSGSIDRLHLLARDHPNIRLACGMDDQALEFFAWGARMWVCAGSNFLPAEHLALYRACVLDGDFATGRRIMSALLPLMRVLEQGGTFVQSVKYGCELAGFAAGPPREPLQPLSEDEERSLAAAITAVRAEIAEIAEVPAGGSATS